jgi:hypothetical protein
MQQLDLHKAPHLQIFHCLQLAHVSTNSPFRTCWLYHCTILSLQHTTGPTAHTSSARCCARTPPLFLVSTITNIRDSMQIQCHGLLVCEVDKNSSLLVYYNKLNGCKQNNILVLPVLTLPNQSFHFNL